MMPVKLQNLLAAVEETLWPRHVGCLRCDQVIDGGSLCPDCERELKGLRLARSAGAMGAVSAYRHEGCARELVLKLKFEACALCAEPLADGMADVLAELEIPGDAVLTWVTMPNVRLRQRGVDHAQLLCSAVAKRTGLPVQQLLDRTGSLVRAQKRLARAQRMANLQGTFCCRQAVTGTVVLVDDVCTTGATLAACTEVLLADGAQRVIALTATCTDTLQDD